MQAAGVKFIYLLTYYTSPLKHTQ